MKTTLVVAVLALFLYTVCGELAEKSAVLASSQTRKLQWSSAASGAEVAESGNGVSETCDPVPHIDFGYTRDGVVIQSFTQALSPQVCHSLCVLSKQDCVAFNYNQKAQTCDLLSKPGSIREDENMMTSLIAFYNDDACNSANFIEGYNRDGYDYKQSSAGKITSAEECCKACKEDYPDCVAWDYGIDYKICFFKKVIPFLAKKTWRSGEVTTGFRAYCYPAASIASST